MFFESVWREFVRCVCFSFMFSAEEEKRGEKRENEVIDAWKYEIVA